MIDELTDAVAFFSDDAACNYVGAMSRWRKGVICPACSSRKTTLQAATLPHRCKACGIAFDWRTGTIYESRRTPLRSWLVTTWAIAFFPDTITPAALADALGIKPTAAGRLLAKVRDAIARGEQILGAA